MKTEQIIEGLAGCLDKLTELEKRINNPYSVWYCSTAARRILVASEEVRDAIKLIKGGDQ